MAIDDGYDARRFDPDTRERLVEVEDGRRIHLVNEGVAAADAGIDNYRPIRVIDEEAEYNRTLIVMAVLRVALRKDKVGEM